MKTGEIVLSIYFGVVTIFIVCFVNYTLGHSNGYLHGADVMKQYIEATGEYPTEDWINAYRSTNFDNCEEILDTLKSWKGRE